MQKQTDLSYTLARRLKARETAAFEYLYEHYSAALYGIILRTLGHEETAQEVLHDVFLKIWNQIEQYNPEKGTLFTWMYRIARNKAVDTRRSKGFKHTDKSVELESYVDSLQAADEGDSLARSSGLKELLRGTTGECQQLIYLNFFAGFSHTDLAEKEDMPLGTVKTRIRSCLKQLRKLMQAEIE